MARIGRIVEIGIELALGAVIGGKIGFDTAYSPVQPCDFVKIDRTGTSESYGLRQEISPEQLENAESNVPDSNLFASLTNYDRVRNAHRNGTLPGSLIGAAAALTIFGEGVERIIRKRN